MLFADKDLDQGLLHLDFKISSSGESLALVQLVGLDTIIIDQLSFGEFSQGLSIGRKVDGGTPWMPLDFTPGQSNSLSDIQLSEEILASVYPNPASDKIFISLQEGVGRQLGIQLINTLGQLMITMPEQEVIPGGVISLDVSDLQDGIYFLKLWEGKSSCVKRIVVYH